MRGTKGDPFVIHGAQPGMQCVVSDRYVVKPVSERARHLGPFRLWPDTGRDSRHSEYERHRLAYRPAGAIHEQERCTRRMGVIGEKT